MNTFITLLVLLCTIVSAVNAFTVSNGNNHDMKQQQQHRRSTALHEKKKEESSGGLFGNWKGMMRDFDDAVDDFLFKRMGAGEQWYGKRKSNPSGRFDGDYNGMGRSDQIKIEIARAMREEMELKKERRLAEEEERRKKKGL